MFGCDVVARCACDVQTMYECGGACRECCEYAIYSRTVTIDAGLIRGRHEMPVDEYIFEDAIEDASDYGSMQCNVLVYIRSRVSRGDIVTINVYVTGLTAAMLSVVKVCNDLNKRGWNIKVNARNYNPVTGEYDSQPVLSK